MTPTCNETDLFRLVEEPLCRDFVANGWRYQDARRIINWFDPADPEYLRRVDAWQQLLCAGAVSDYSLISRGLFDAGVCRLVPGRVCSIMDANPYDVQLVHFVAKLFYKFRGKPRKETVFSEVKERLRHPLPISLEPCEVSGMSCNLLRLRPPSTWEELVGNYGPGISADRLTPAARWRLEGAIPRGVPITLYVYSADDYAALPATKYYRYGITEIAEVPKSLKANRIISSEPANGMFAQLAVGRALVSELHRNFGKHISLYDQQRHNRLLWQPGACSIDLSDASDHVSRRLVYQLLPLWRTFLFSVRSTFARFPDGELVPLRTFAPMGSGVCFPTLTTVSAGLLSYACRHNWHAYGDDWIVHVRDYDYVTDLAKRAGLTVNFRKSCCNLIYRESCGVELFRELDITPFYVREPFDNVDASVADRFLGYTERLLLPSLRDVVLPLMIQGSRPRLRYNTQLQRWEVRHYGKIPINHGVHLPGNRALFRWFCVQSQSDVEFDSQMRFRRIRFNEDASRYPYLVPWLASKIGLNQTADDATV